ncbi:tetrapyrrole (corrin/porphyrin) methylase (plasmid) [Legionella adelaidensis]|uniref:Ribosomal RNA small subunit methyltransferase I n=1 Tax=Legionella adelaidensis TaxID=45056 RepID=A0A0W0R194_9GAMM|nr:16S rRNA (cytidine(1402)-2'-O)-methyltransferase [Legionella adelaidensis]KTC64821.1 tetrapyrrole (corrin/porphyrin) methylase [Legionella adelaidensis]VEH86189.1 tetrapyrrole (corrin/porphyrin) methylase [Legionella adelaidensis]
MVGRSSTSAGILYVVATPIGNLEDISRRAIRIFAEVDAILAEDTRHSRQLLNALGIQKTLISLHAHNESIRVGSVIDELLIGKNFALISDAGTPLINDPGFPLVKAAREQGITVTPIPGACALIAALSAAGIPCDLFTFAGFLPVKQSSRRERLNELKSLNHTLIFYESTHRILECLHDIATIFGDSSQIVLAKELTKTFETFVSSTTSEVIKWLGEEESRQKGEFVLILPPRVTENLPSLEEDKLLALLIKEMPVKKAVKIVVEMTGGNKNDLYRKALELK